MYTRKAASQLPDRHSIFGDTNGRVSMTTEYVVYALLDPRTNVVRYIGLTSMPRERKRAHQNGEGAAYCGCWERSLIEKGLRPEFKILESGLTLQEAGDREAHWITYGHQQDWQLTNLSGGGEGGGKHAEETKAKIAEAQRGRSWHHTPEAKAKIGEASRRAPRTEEWCRRISEGLTGRTHPHKGVPRSEECKAKLRAANLGRQHTEETKRKIGDAGRGRKHSEETKAKISGACKRKAAQTS